MNWLQHVKKWSLPKIYPTIGGESVPPDMYHFERERDGQFARFHLRVEPDGRSLLLACASEAVILSPIATKAAWSILDGKEDETIPSEVAETVDRLIRDIGTPSARYPILQLDDPEATGRGRALAPVQADVIVDEAMPIAKFIDRLWAARIPHARFRPNRTDVGDYLVPAVEHAEDIGMITGLRSLARPLCDGDLLDRLAGVGLDYVVVPWAVAANVHRALFGCEAEEVTDLVRRILSLEITPVLEIPLIEPTVDALDDELPAWLDRGITNFEVFALATPPSSQADDLSSTAAATSLTASGRPGDEGGGSVSESERLPSDLRPLQPQSLRQIASWIDDLSAEHGISISWLPPVLAEDRSALERHALDGPRTGGRFSVRIEGDGNVVPPCGPCVATANLMNDSWETIWQHDAFEAIRRRRKEVVYCDQCPRLDVCATGCPSDPQTWATPIGWSPSTQNRDASQRDPSQEESP